MNSRPLTRLVPLLLALLPGLAGAADWQSLLGNSPFGATGPAAATTATGDFEFRGVVQEEGVYFVNLYNPTSKTSQWIEVKGKVPGLEVQSYDPGADKVQIMQAGRPLTLPLKQARIALVAAVATPPAGGDKGANPDGRENLDDRRAQIRDMVRARLEGGPGGEPSPLMRNLPPEAQAMIEEYRRRRADRGANQPGGPQPAVALPAERVRRGQP